MTRLQRSTPPSPEGARREGGWSRGKRIATRGRLRVDVGPPAAPRAVGPRRRPNIAIGTGPNNSSAGARRAVSSALLTKAPAGSVNLASPVQAIGGSVGQRGLPPRGRCRAGGCRRGSRGHDPVEVGAGFPLRGHRTAPRERRAYLELIDYHLEVGDEIGAEGILERAATHLPRDTKRLRYVASPPCAI